MHRVGNGQGGHKGTAPTIYDEAERISLNTRGFVLVFVVVAWLVGIVLGSLFTLPTLALVPGAVIALLFVVPLRHDRRGRLIMLIIACVLLGACRYMLASPLNDAHSIRLLVGAKKITVRGTVADEPKLSGRSRTLVVAVSGVQQNGIWQAGDGQLSVLTLGSQVEDPYGANYGDVVELQGTLAAPAPHSSLETVASMSFPRISVSQNQGNRLLAFFYHLRLLLANVIAQALPQPEAALLIALALSLRTPALQITTIFNAIGCAHLIAPSGYKVTVFAALIETSMRQVYRRPKKRLLPAQLRRQQWSMACVLAISVVVYTLLSGAVPAAIRAGIMGVLLVVAAPLGRRYNVYTALALVALLLSILDPFVLWDIGFQLSFLGTLGIVLFTPYFQRLLVPMARLPFGHIIVEIMAVTLAAQVATLPLIAVTFSTISFIAPIANVLTVPLLGMLIILGAAIASAGLLFLPLALLLGWLAFPFLWYLVTITHLLYILPFAYADVTIPDNVAALISWSYYVLLVVVMYAIQRQSQIAVAAAPTHSTPHIPSIRVARRTRFLLQVGAALLILAATGTAVLASRSAHQQLSITFLNVGPAGKLPQGEAIFLRTPDGKTLLIDGGSDATSLASALDSRLPSWQRSLDVVVLTSPRTDDLTGLLDAVTRYQVGEVIDAGMLHPGATYALWRSTIQQRHIHYVPAAQGAVIHVGMQMTLQVLWPGSPLHKGSDEVRDNSMVLRLVTPNVRMLLIGDVAESTYGLTHLLSTTAPNQMTAEIVQIVGEVGKAFPVALTQVLQQAHPDYLIVSPASLSSKLRKHTTTTVISVPQTWIAEMPHMRVMQTAQSGSLEVSGNGNGGWSIGKVP